MLSEPCRSVRRTVWVRGVHAFAPCQPSMIFCLKTVLGVCLKVGYSKIIQIPKVLSPVFQLELTYDCECLPFSDTRTEKSKYHLVGLISSHVPSLYAHYATIASYWGCSSRAFHIFLAGMIHRMSILSSGSGSKILTSLMTM